MHNGSVIITPGCLSIKNVQLNDAAHGETTEY